VQQDTRRASVLACIARDQRQENVHFERLMLIVRAHNPLVQTLCYLIPHHGALLNRADEKLVLDVDIMLSSAYKVAHGGMDTALSLADACRPGGNAAQGLDVTGRRLVEDMPRNGVVLVGLGHKLNVGIVVAHFFRLDVVPALDEVTSDVAGSWSANAAGYIVPGHARSFLAVDRVLEWRVNVDDVFEDEVAVVLADPEFGGAL